MSSADPQDTTVDEVCYRHPDRPSGVSCQRCDRFICSECMHQASVGVHCPECTANKKQKVYTPSTLPGSQGLVTRALVGINVAIFVASILFLGSSLTGIGNQALRDFGTFGPFISEDGDWWRVISGGFLHSGLIHIGFNMYLLWQLGQQIERLIGPKSYVAVYLASLFGGSFGALLLDPDIPVVGASGAVFGLIGFTVLMYRSRGIGLFDTGLGFLIVINALYSLRGGVSLGGHGGGFVVGVILGVLFFGLNPGAEPILGSDTKKQVGASILVGIVFFLAALWAASTWMAPVFG
jgi:membrane associated rhomboid family serine protease